MSYASSESIPWADLRAFGILNRIMQCKRGRPTSGRILSYCKDQVAAFRENMGINLTVFKIGVTAEPAQRFMFYRQENYTNMWVLHTSACVQEIHMLEAALISHFQCGTGCRNTPNSGGEGALNRQNSQGPYFAYVVGGRADQNKRVG